MCGRFAFYSPSEATAALFGVDGALTVAPRYISLASGAPFALAGLWENWKNKETDESLQTTTLITTSANGPMKSL